MVATRGQTFKRPWRRSCLSSKLKSSSAPIGRKDSWCFHAVGSSNAPLLGSTAAEGLPRIGRTSIATRWRSCGLPQSASCSENFVIPPDVFGQTLRVGRGRFFDRNIWPDSCIFRIQRQPFLKPGFAISLDSINGALRFANATVDAFVRMDDEHILALVEAVHGAHLDAVHGFAANAAIVDDVGQLGVLPADCRGQLPSLA